MTDSAAERLYGAVPAGSTDGVPAFGRELRRGGDLHLVVWPASPRERSNGAAGVRPPSGIGVGTGQPSHREGTAAG